MRLWKRCHRVVPALSLVWAVMYSWYKRENRAYVLLPAIGRSFGSMCVFSSRIPKNAWNSARMPERESRRFLVGEKLVKNIGNYLPNDSLHLWNGKAKSCYFIDLSVSFTKWSGSVCGGGGFGLE